MHLTIRNFWNLTQRIREKLKKEAKAKGLNTIKVRAQVQGKIKAKVEATVIAKVREKAKNSLKEQPNRRKKIQPNITKGNFKDQIYSKSQNSSFTATKRAKTVPQPKVVLKRNNNSSV